MLGVFLLAHGRELTPAAVLHEVDGHVGRHEVGLLALPTAGHSLLQQPLFGFLCGFDVPDLGSAGGKSISVSSSVFYGKG